MNGYNAVQEPHVASDDFQFGARSVVNIRQNKFACHVGTPLKITYAIGVLVLVFGCVRIKLDFKGFGADFSPAVESQLRRAIWIRCALTMAAEQYQYDFPVDSRRLRGKSVQVNPLAFCSSHITGPWPQRANLIGYTVDDEPPPASVSEIVKPFNDYEWKEICTELNKVPANSISTSVEIDATFVSYYRIGDARTLARLVLFAKSLDADGAIVEIVCLEAGPCDALTLQPRGSAVPKKR